MRELVCLACDDRVPLQGRDARCACRSSAARHDDDGWTYGGPAVVVLSVPMHEPEHRRVRERSIRMPDDAVSHRAQS
jgi:hypothetical protein